MRKKQILKIAFTLYWALVLGLCVYTQLNSPKPGLVQQTGMYGGALLLIIAMAAYISKQYPSKQPS